VIGPARRRAVDEGGEPVRRVVGQPRQVADRQSRPVVDEAGDATARPLRRRPVEGLRRRPAERPLARAARPDRRKAPSRRRQLRSQRRQQALETDGPHVTLGVLWAGVTLFATIEGPVWSAVLLAPVAALAAASTFRSWHGRPAAEPDADSATPQPPLALLAGSASAVVVLASVAGLWATLVVGVLVVIGIVASEVKASTGPPGLLQRTLLILLPAAAGSGLVLARAQGLSEGVALVAMISFYDSAAYLIGTGARFAVEGPIAGLASIGALTLFLAAMPPFAGDTPWILGGLAAVLAPLGPIVARRLTPEPSARVPALRRLDSLIVLGPAWGAATALLLH
jgi:hypothetical protein